MKITDIRNVLARPAGGGGLSRPVIDTRSLEQTVAAILDEVKRGGDEAVRKLAMRFDKSAPAMPELDRREMEEGAGMVGDELKTAIREAQTHIHAFHAQQQYSEPVVETRPGVRCWRRAVAIEKVGLYIPGGTAPLFSTLLMLAIPAKIAGCRDIVLCS